MNNEPKFDPLTGEPINNTDNSKQQVYDTLNEQTSIQDNLQSIATVDQSSDQFINNVQTEVKNQTSENKEKTSYAFIIILFVIIFAAIFFLFPLISKYI